MFNDTNFFYNKEIENLSHSESISFEKLQLDNRVTFGIKKKVNDSEISSNLLAPIVNGHARFGGTIGDEIRIKGYNGALLPIDDIETHLNYILLRLADKHFNKQ